MQILTPRLLVRPFTFDDAEAYVRIYNDPQMASWLAYELPFNMDDARESLEPDIREIAEYGYGRFAVTLRDSGEVIGRCGIRTLEDQGDRLPEVGYQIRTDQWGYGYATEASRAVRDWGFANHDFPQLFSFIRHDNHASQAVAKRNRYSIWRETVRADLAHSIWRITREEWTALPPEDRSEG